MTKLHVKKFLESLGNKCFYSGRTKTMFVKPLSKLTTDDDVNIEVVQHFGIMPDFTIRIAL